MVEDVGERGAGPFGGQGGAGSPWGFAGDVVDGDRGGAAGAGALEGGGEGVGVELGLQLVQALCGGPVEEFVDPEPPLVGFDGRDGPVVAAVEGVQGVSMCPASVAGAGSAL